MKTKNIEKGECVFCGKKTIRFINFHKNNRKYGHFICKECKPTLCGGG
jgi:hypothetical protein